MIKLFMEGTKEVKKRDLHNLKSGLTAVLGYLQLAEYKAKSLDSEESKKIEELIKKATNSAKSLELQIKNLEEEIEPLMDL